ncbi:hypothetical protein [Calidithermus roseus]|nr:hypothetical protein [Calidithermus roseus]
MQRNTHVAQLSPFSPALGVRSCWNMPTPHIPAGAFTPLEGGKRDGS